MIEPMLLTEYSRDTKKYAHSFGRVYVQEKLDGCRAIIDLHKSLIYSRQQKIKPHLIHIVIAAIKAASHLPDTIHYLYGKINRPFIRTNDKRELFP